MPLPVPTPGESLQQFIARAIADESMVSEFTDEGQRTAVAYVQWGRDKLTFKNLLPGKTVIRRKIVSTSVMPGETSGKTLAGYASVHGVQDLEHDIMLPGCWTKTLDERVASGKVPLMTQHVATGGTVTDTIGWMQPSSRDDSTGLWAEFLLVDTDQAKQCWELSAKSIETMTPMGLSVEFFPIKYEPNAFGGFTFAECKLIQVTLTPTPCNELSAVYVAKSPHPAAAVRRDWTAYLGRMTLRTVGRGSRARGKDVK